MVRNSSALIGTSIWRALDEDRQLRDAILAEKGERSAAVIRPTSAITCALREKKVASGMQTEVEQNNLYEGSCPYCYTDEMYDAKSVPRSVMHSPLGCRLPPMHL